MRRLSLSAGSRARIERWAFVALMFAVTGCDQATKHLAASGLTGAPHQLLPGILDLRRTVNTDTAFGLLGDFVPLRTRLTLLVLFSIVGITVLLVFLRTQWLKLSLAERLGGALALGGAIGNAIDRAGRHYVIDFIHVPYWPTFNVADIGITVGVGLWLVAALLRRRGMAPTSSGTGTAG